MEHTDTISFSAVVCLFFALAMALLFDDVGFFTVPLPSNGRRILLIYPVMWQWFAFPGAGTGSGVRETQKHARLSEYFLAMGRDSQFQKH
jgi:hypothetical protein